MEEMKKYELAITGNAFQFMIDAIEKGKESENTLEVYRKAIMHAKIYARMSPDHKAMLVEELQNNMKEMIGM